MADCAYTFTGPDGKPLTIVGVPGLKAYLVDGGLEHLFPERKFPLKAVAQISRGEEPAEKPTRKNTFQNQAAAEEHLLQSFGSGIKNLISSKVLNFTQGKDSWPEKVQRQLRGGEEAVYVNGKAYIDLQAINKDRLDAVVLHEIGEHFNLKLMLGPEGYKSLQDQITNRAKIKGSQAEKIWNQVERLYPDLEVGSEAFVSEVIAKLGEANPQAPWYRRLLTRIKAFLVERGLGRGFITGTMTEDDMHDLLRTSLMSAAGRYAQGEARVFGEGVMASVPRPEILTLLEEFANDDEVFKHPISDKKSIEDIMAEVAPAYSFDERRSDLVSTDKVKTSVFVTPRKRLIFINESDGKVWLNVSKMKPGDAGGAIYAAVGNYAYNNGLKFIDDPAGLSAASVKRRPVHMLSLALKFGTTDFMDVSENFDALSKQLGLPELNWKNDYDSDLSSLIFRNAFYVYSALPELHRINYDFKTDRFRDDTGGVLPEVWARRLSRRDAARSNSIGDSTIRRAVFLKSLASATGEEKSRLLENYRANGGLAGRVSLKGIFSRPIENLQPAPEERTPLWNRWFGKSKMQRGGEPIKFYHGSQAEFTVFDKSRLATNTTHTTAGLGHFFTMRKEEAKSYGGNVKEVFLSIQKPYVTFSWSLDSKFKDAAGAAKFREKLQAEGYDGVFIKDAGYAVTFESNQAKLTENQSPTFGEDVRFSRIGTVEDGETYEEAFWRDNQPSVLQLMKEKMEDATDAARKIMLAGLGVNHMIEIMSNSLPTLKALGRSILLRDTAKMDIILEADSIVVDAKNNLDNTVRARLNRVINESTDVDADASLAWSGIESSEGKGTGTTVYTVHTQANLSENYKNAANLAAISLGLKPSKATGKAFVRNRATFTDRAKAEAFLAELQKIEQRQSDDTSNAKLNKTNQKRKAEHAKLYSALMTLGEEPIRLYRAMNAQHTSVMEQQLEEITVRIENAISDRRLRSEMIANTRRAFEDNSLQWYYAPLTRFGDYWFYGTIEKDGEIEHWREHFNSEKALNRKIALFEKKGGKLIGRGKRLQNIEQFGSVGAADSYVADIQSKIAKHLDVNDPAVQQLQDSIYQFHLSTLPDVSIRHSRQHRKGVKGAETDAFKSFSDKMHHASTQLANMKYGAEIAEIMTDHQEMKKLWENSNYLKSAEAKVEAIKLLQDDWDTIAKPGVLEALRDKAEIDKDFEKFGIYKEAINVRNKFGGALRDQLDKDGKVIGQIGSEGYEVEEGLARLKDRTEKHVTGAKNIQDKDKTLAADVIDELLMSVDAMMKTQTTDIDRWAMKLSALNFTGMMGFGVSSALVNIVQTPGVAAPVIGARYGFAKTMATLNKTASWFLKAAFNGLKDEDGNISITGYLLAEYEKANAAGDSAKAKELMAIHDALDTFKKDGTIGRTQTFDLLGVAQDGLGSSSIFFDIAKKGGFMFHHAERFNREVTLAAAYLLSKNDTARTPRQEGESDTAYKKRVDEAAIDYARWANERAHLNYSAEVAARIFRGPVARISMQFRKYTHGMMFLWGKALHDSLATIKKEDFPTAEAWEAAKEAKLEARRTFLGLLFMQTSFAGAMGLPMMGTLGIAYSLLAGDDDDIPADLERDLTAILVKWFGEDIGYGLARGFIDKATPVALSTRLELKDIYFREPLKEMEGRDEGAAYALQVLGPTGGSFLNVWQGLSDMAKGDVLKGGEKLLPKAVGDILKAYRLGTEGATTRQGDHIKDMKAMEVMLQSIGFGSSELQRYYVESGFAKSAEDSLEKARQSVVSKVGRAMATGGEADTDLVDAWNEKHPEWPIRYQDLAASAKRVTSNIEERSEKGYLLNPKLEYLREEYDFFSDEDED